MSVDLRRGCRPGRAQRGISLVEMLVGVALGLFIVAAAAALGAAQLSENRRLLLETQVQQDLRATTDIITRELRRAAAPLQGVSHGTLWLPDAPNTMPTANLLAMTTPVSGDVITYKYERATSLPEFEFGFGLNGNVIVSRTGSTSQPLTDVNTLRVTAFSVTETAGAAIQLACDKLCPDGTQACWPTVRARDYVISITGSAPSDPLIQRTMTSRVRIRNDAVTFNGPGVCPT